MKKFEIPEITISMFDKAVQAADASAVGKAKTALGETGEVTQVGQAAWGSAQDWTVSF